MRPRAPGPGPSGACAGFTLLELLVAAALTLAVAGAVVGVFVTTNRHRRRSEALLESAASARGALDRIAREVEGCYATAYSDGTAYAVFQAPAGGEATEADPLLFTSAAESPGQADFCEATWYARDGMLWRKLRAPGLAAPHQGAKPLARRIGALYVEAAAHAAGEAPAWVKLTLEVRDPRLTRPGDAGGEPRAQLFTVIARPGAAKP